MQSLEKWGVVELPKQLSNFKFLTHSTVFENEAQYDYGSSNHNSSTTRNESNSYFYLFCFLNEHVFTKLLRRGSQSARKSMVL